MLHGTIFMRTDAIVLGGFTRFYNIDGVQIVLTFEPAATFPVDSTLIVMLLQHQQIIIIARRNFQIPRLFHFLDSEICYVEIT
jgi:hypothetical protein